MMLSKNAGANAARCSPPANEGSQIPTPPHWWPTYKGLRAETLAANSQIYWTAFFDGLFVPRLLKQIPSRTDDNFTQPCNPGSQGVAGAKQWT
jgi:hypothetical protein